MKPLCLTLAALVLLVSLAGAAGARLNLSPSVPCGLYWQGALPFRKGDTVLVCPPSTPLFAEVRARGYLGPGFCPSGSQALMKRVAALPGDRVELAPEGVRVNGRLLPQSVPLAFDQAGRPLPRLASESVIVAPGEVLLMGETVRSFDGRYFGLLPSTAIESVLHPLLTW